MGETGAVPGDELGVVAALRPDAATGVRVGLKHRRALRAAEHDEQVGLMVAGDGRGAVGGDQIAVTFRSGFDLADGAGQTCAGIDRESPDRRRR